MHGAAIGGELRPLEGGDVARARTIVEEDAALVGRHARRMMIFESVVLPEPDSPTMPSVSPRSTERLTLVSAATRKPAANGPPRLKKVFDTF